MNPIDHLKDILAPEQVKVDWLTRVAWASDASFYRLLPQAVVFPATVNEIQSLFQWSHHHQIPLTFRAAGTSLSGQAVTDGVLVDISRHWREIEVLAHGQQVRVQPGVIGAHVNRALRSWARKIGPDPASIHACMMGGILANNASGMCCGVSQNAYHTLASLKLVLPHGLVVDSSQPTAAQQLESLAPHLCSTLRQLRQQVLGNPDLQAKIRQKYQLKNTTGYALNALLDYESPLEILSHLVIGSEGTLAFIAEAVLNTVPDYPYKWTGLLLFATVQAACDAILPLKSTGARALELMDRASLRSVESQNSPVDLRILPPTAAALLIEYQETTAEQLHLRQQEARICLQQLHLLQPPLLTEDPSVQAQLWKIRKGLFPSIGAIRQQGTTVIIEDVVFPLQHLAEAVTDLQALFRQHAYPEGIIFGHASEGNLHFVITQSFNDPAAIERYDAFIQNLVALVVHRYDGALKAEHGTGRNMAPFVATEWGPVAYGLMQQIKAALDPLHLLNPGVILNPEPQAHIQHLKSLPVVDPQINACIECGFCEPACPSRRLSLSPRQRIVVQREMQRLESQPDHAAILNELNQAYQYAGVETCATDGLCALSCPVAIDTGIFVKQLRHTQAAIPARQAAQWLAHHFKAVEHLAHWGLTVGGVLKWGPGPWVMRPVLQKLQQWLGIPLPQWPSNIPRSAPHLPMTSPTKATFIYIPSCISRVIGPHQSQDPALPEVMLTLAQRAGLPTYIPADIMGHCCGLPFTSKGFSEAGANLLNNLIERLWVWSKAGTLPIVMDTTPCTYHLLNQATQLTPDNQARWRQLQIYDAIEWTAQQLLPRLTIQPQGHTILHPVCSATKLNLTPVLEHIAEVCSQKTTIPIHAGCCGFAGDRGLLFPELTATAVADEKNDLQHLAATGYYASSRTCEWGLSMATEKPYRSFLYLVEEASRPPL